MMRGACIAPQRNGSGAHDERNVRSMQNRVSGNVIAVAEFASCAEVASVMAEHHIASVGVHKGGKLVGTVTIRDLPRFLGVFADPRNTPIAAALRAREGIPGPSRAA